MGTDAAFPPFRATSGELVRRCADRWGDAPFVVLGDERLTYAEADARSAALAKGLLAAGVGKSTHVGLLAPNGPDWVVAWLAATRIGALVALLNTYGKTRELGRSLRHADVAHLLTVESHLGHDHLDRLQGARHIAVFAGQADLPQLDSGKVDRRRLAQILGERFGPVAPPAAP